MNGKVRVNKKVHFRAKGNKKFPQVVGYKNIDVTSGTRSKFRNLSPMFLGPTNTNPQALRVENLWQFSKVYDVEVDEKESPTQAYFDRRDAGYADPKGNRHPKPGGNFLYHYWNDEKLDRVTARKKIYIPYYMDLVSQRPEYQDLINMLNSGINIQILGYDGVDYDCSSDKDGKIALQMLEDVSHPFGHELVLACMLVGIKLI